MHSARHCCDRVSSVAIENMVRPIETENSLLRQNSYVAGWARACCDTVHTLSPVATPRLCLDTQHPVLVATASSLSRHRTSHLCHNRKLLVSTEQPKRPVATGRPRHTRARAGASPFVMHVGTPVMHALVPFVATPLQCHNPRLKMGSSPFWPPALQLAYYFFFFVQHTLKPT